MFFSFWLPVLTSALIVPFVLGRLYPLDKTQEQPQRSTWANLIFVITFNGLAVLVAFLLGSAIQYGRLYSLQSPAYTHIILPESAIFYLGAGFLMYGWVGYGLGKALVLFLGKEKAEHFSQLAEPDNGIDNKKLEKHSIYWVMLASLIGAGILFWACSWHIRVGKDDIMLKLPFEAEKKLAYQDLKKIEKNTDKNNLSHTIHFKTGDSFSTANLQDKEAVYELFAKYLPTAK